VRSLPTPPPAGKGLSMDRHRIVVVDDEDGWLRTIKRALGDQYQLDLTTDPAEARALVRMSPCALAILDQRLSAELSGVDLLHDLREVQPGLRGIIRTGYADIDDAVASIRGGAFDYISQEHRNLSTELRARVTKALKLEDNPPDEDLVKLLEQGKGSELEFQPTVRWDVRQSKANRDVEAVIVRTVAGFLNVDGGVLLIGVDDRGNVVGLRHDYATLRKQDRDGFESFLTKLLLDALGREVSPCIRIGFHRYAGKEVCLVIARAAPHAASSPTRTGASTSTSAPATQLSFSPRVKRSTTVGSAGRKGHRSGVRKDGKWHSRPADVHRLSSARSGRINVSSAVRIA
jgi:ActR/RegA family two-component response regulator